MQCAASSRTVCAVRGQPRDGVAGQLEVAVVLLQADAGVADGFGSDQRGTGAAEGSSTAWTACAAWTCPTTHWRRCRQACSPAWKACAKSPWKATQAHLRAHGGTGTAGRRTLGARTGGAGGGNRIGSAVRPCSNPLGIAHGSQLTTCQLRWTSKPAQRRASLSRQRRTTALPSPSTPMQRQCQQHGAETTPASAASKPRRGQHSPCSANRPRVAITHPRTPARRRRTASAAGISGRSGGSVGRTPLGGHVVGRGAGYGEHHRRQLGGNTRAGCHRHSRSHPDRHRHRRLLDNAAP